ncbi:MAG TPA: GerMN domain-containing protein [Pseudobacteroides sp.]|uniref:GerMN domain-containing protein n=1 Tax=Pseudobacteroides sp. TaxID=1968840 RepID=UPI002F951038
MIRKLAALLTFIMLFTFTACSFDAKNKTTKSNPDGIVSQGQDEPSDKENGNSMGDSEDSKTTRQKVTLYFSNIDNTALIKEIRDIEISEMAVLRSTVEALAMGPKNSELKKTLPDGVSILGIRRDGKTVVVDFSKEYNGKQEGITEEFKRISVVNTLTAIAGIEKVKIMVEGRELVNSNGKVFGEMDEVDLDKSGKPLKEKSQVITVYFGSPDTDFIVGEKRKVSINVNGSLEKEILEELLKGPQNKDLYPIIPENTKVLSVTTSEDGTCKINLSKEFQSNAFAGSAGGAITINSIVNSLTELKTVKRVQFLIEGKVVETYSDMGFDKPFYRNEKIIKNAN